MSGKDVKRQVEEALRVPPDFVGQKVRRLEAMDALAPCTVLTPEEREALAVLLLDVPPSAVSKSWSSRATRLYPLLQPELHTTPRDPHTYVVNEDDLPSSGAGGGSLVPGGLREPGLPTNDPAKRVPAPDEVEEGDDGIGGPLPDDYYDGVPEDVREQTGGPC